MPLCTRLKRVGGTTYHGVTDSLFGRDALRGLLRRTGQELVTGNVYDV